MPVVDGRSPVRMAVRDGLHFGEGACALVKRTPLSAKRSMFGVSALSYPSAPTQSFMSSTLRNRTFGRSCPLVPHAARPATRSAGMIKAFVIRSATVTPLAASLRAPRIL